jgi:nucleoid-associated protein YgaU
MSNKEPRKAYIEILKGSKKGEEISLQFNPSEYSIERINTFKEKKLKNLKNMKKQFQEGKESDISLNILFDSTDDGTDVRDKIEKFSWLIDIDPEIHAPPPCMFIWAKFKVIAVVTKLTKKFTYFYQDGVPARVRISLTLKPYKTTKEIEAETKKHSADLTKVRAVNNEGDNIWLMAHREYEDPRLWRSIANANEIDDPRVIDYGRKLVIPPRKKHE